MLLRLALVFLAVGDTRTDADALFRAGRYREAASAYVTLLRQSPDDTALMDAVGQTLRRMNQPGASIPFFQRELTLDPANRAAMRSLGAALQEANAFEEAERWLTRLTALDPKDSESWYRLGLVLYQNGYYNAAAEDLQRALALGQDGVMDQYRNHAEATRIISLLEAGRTAEARQALPELLAKPQNEANLDLRLAYARLLYEDGNYDGALKQTDLAVAANPANAAAHLWRARIFQRQNLIPQAIGEAEHSRDLSQDSPAPRSLLIRLYQKAGRAQDAAREAEWLRIRETQAAKP